jgi:hypothetical protein
MGINEDESVNDGDDPGRDPAGEPEVFVLGVRHHGPGSARSVVRALEAIEPDSVLIEGPPDADSLIPLAADPAMKPPVALLVYRVDRPRSAAFYPFAAFSPEWRAIVFALERGVPVRFMDSPLSARGFDDDDSDDKPNVSAPDNESENPDVQESQEHENKESLKIRKVARIDPLQELALAAGYDDGEAWWEDVVEHRRDGFDRFESIVEAMAEIRSAFADRSDDPDERIREASMRKIIRSEQSDGRRRIAVVCGAWHAPALVPSAWPGVKDDAAALKRLRKIKTAATWIPWTHGRMTRASGYGAGIASPGWYEHLWTAPDRVVDRWMAKTARLLRSEGLEASSASVIDAVRLADAVAALRGKSPPGLDELVEATRAVFCFNNDIPLRLIHKKLIVGETIGGVPGSTPRAPLREDFERLRKKLRLVASPDLTIRTLDLRDANDLERSRFLHRLALMGIDWGALTYSNTKGTFKEAWELAWRPEFEIDLIEAGAWGSTIVDAATAKACDLAERASDLPKLAELVDRAIVADLAAAVEPIMKRFEDKAAIVGDVDQLMNALPPLANLARYGDVRGSDFRLIAHATDAMIARIGVNLPPACLALDDDAATATVEAIVKADSAIRLIDKPEHVHIWTDALLKIVDAERTHRKVSGRCCRILFDARSIEALDLERRMSLDVSATVDPDRAAAWIEGFFKGNGDLLYYDDALFAIVDDWLGSISGESFINLAPILRRTFADLDAPLRRNLGEKARELSDSRRDDGSKRTASRRTGDANSGRAEDDRDRDAFDASRAALVAPLVARLLGLEYIGNEESIENKKVNK